ncbi:FAD:protein FMN transferase [Mycoplana sp. MJR14]|uniref:FAD:protein FMN transferase n=1 Tax=Mycoplana sp. MJR14 TaxID=3032583 RepID=UPI000DD92816|nr:FAD:protein FMN transferase [Mycoplana sp. MJR14]MDF1632864.1 FAD:protein FMN transferase [Mycoplana sp. MJR14]
MAKGYTRRRAIAIFAAAAGLPLLTAAKAASSTVTWKGQALGAPATLILNHEDRARAERLIDTVVAEVTRLERAFSLYRDDTALSELNRVGALVAPPQDLVALLGSCQEFWNMSDGGFDPTIQPLWSLYRDHFTRPEADPSGPSAEKIRDTLDAVGFEGIRFDRDRIVLTRPKMALTLNGIAQGYVTDRIVDLLRDAGVTSSLVNMGENRAVGSRLDGTPWRIGLAERQDDAFPDVVLDVIDKAVATSSGMGFHFDKAQRFSHILDPRTGGAAALYRRVTVIADDATTADALSTAFSLMDETIIRSTLDRRSGVLVDLVRADGGHRRFETRA